MAHGIVCVGTFPNGPLAAMAQGLLEENGIVAHVSGALTQSFAGGDVPYLGVRLEVGADDAERARLLLDEVEARTRARLDAEEGVVGELPDDADDVGDGDDPDDAPPDEPGPDEGLPSAGAAEAGADAGPPTAAQLTQPDGPPRLPGDRAATRALTCAVFGCMVPLFGLAALALLADLALRHEELPLSERGRRTVRWTAFWTVITAGLFVTRWFFMREVGGGWTWLLWLWLWVWA